MSTRLVSSNEFASLVNKLQKTPEDPNLKRIIIQHLPQIRELAQKDPLALYHLAHIFPPNSALYKQTMLQSADLGCTNAMLEACSFLLKSSHPKELRRATDYLERIKQSQDTYIMMQAEKLYKDKPAQPATAHKVPNKTGHEQMHGFFARKPERNSTLKSETGDKITVQP